MNFSRRLACFYKKFQDVYLSTQFEFEGLENEIYNFSERFYSINRSENIQIDLKMIQYLTSRDRLFYLLKMFLKKNKKDSVCQFIE